MKIILLTIMLLFGLFLRAQDATTSFNNAKDAYERGDYSESVKWLKTCETKIGYNTPRTQSMMAMSYANQKDWVNAGIASGIYFKIVPQSARGTTAHEDMVALKGTIDSNLQALSNNYIESRAKERDAAAEKAVASQKQAEQAKMKSIASANEDKIYKLYSNNTNPGSVNEFASLYPGSSHVDDLKKALELNLEKIELEMPEYKEGMVAKEAQNYSLAMIKFKEAAAKGNANAMHEIGALYYFGQGVTTDYNESMRWNQKSADKGCKAGLNSLGFLYQEGKGTPQDYGKAMMYYQKAVEKGNTDAIVNIGALYGYGRGVAQNNSEALGWYKKAAEKGNALAMDYIGNFYRNGWDVSQDYGEALKWYKKAAEKGYDIAMNDIGVLYAKGWGVEQNYTEAFVWYKKAAEKGNSIAMNNIGNLYYYGSGVKQNYSEAMKWYVKAAENGNVAARDNVGHLYWKGLGVKKNRAKAKEWMSKPSTTK